MAGLRKLRHSGLGGAGAEMATLGFIQPFGQDWPLPSTRVLIPHDLVLLLLDYCKFDPRIWMSALQTGERAPDVLDRIPNFFHSPNSSPPPIPTPLPLPFDHSPPSTFL